MKTPRCAVLVLAALLPFLSGCNFAAVQQQANDLIKKLQAQESAGQWDTIYTDADPEYRKALSQEKSRLLFQGIQKKLGKPTGFDNVTWQVQATTSGKYIRASFHTRYDTGKESHDSCSWRADGTTYRLINWNINSLDLLTQ